MSKYKHLLTELEVQRLYEFSKQNPGYNIWVEIKPNGIASNVKIAIQQFDKSRQVSFLDITDIDSW